MRASLPVRHTDKQKRKIAHTKKGGNRPRKADSHRLILL